MVVDVVGSAVAQVDAADVRDVELRPARMAHDNDLLMVRASRTHPHVAKTLAAGGLDLVAEMVVLLRAERELVPVRPPNESLDDDAAGRCRAQHPRHLGAVTVEPLIRVAAPVGEHDEVAGDGSLQGLQQFGKVHRAVHERSYVIAGGVRAPIASPPIERGEGVAASVGVE